MPSTRHRLRRYTWITRLLPVCAIGVLAIDRCGAQSAGGAAGAALRTPMFAHQIAMAGVDVPYGPDASSLFANPSALGWLETPSVAATWSSATLGVVGSGAIGAAIPIGRFAAVGVGASTTSSIEQGAYDTRRQRTGSFVDRELGFLIGGSLAIGPGSVGATLRMLRRDLTGFDVSNSGYAVDIGGTVSFGERLYAGIVLANIAGEMVAGESTLRERIPWEGRLSATYVHALEERVESSRLDPSGTPLVRRIRPRAYVIGTAGLRLAGNDSVPTLGFAAEVVPLTSIAVGFRAGITTAGEISGGFLYRLPVEFTDELRLDYAVRWDDATSDVTHHVGITAGI